jgi:hypothetical protein
MPKRKVKPEAAKIEGPPLLSVMLDAKAGEARAASFFKEELDRAEARRAALHASPAKVLTAEERAEIAEQNASHISIMQRIPAHGVRAWSALAPVSRGSSADDASP